MFNPIPLIVWLISIGLGWVLFQPNPDSLLSMIGFGATVLAGWYVSAAFRIAKQWEKALVFRLGRFRAVKGPGVFTVLPLFDSVRAIDTRILTIEIPTQQAITRDNVPVSLDGVIFLRVESPADAIIRVQDFRHAIRQYAQTTLRDVIGALTLDQILADREHVGQQIQQLVESEITGWGLEVAAIRIQDIVLPEDLKRVMARQASAEREKRANITKSEGDREAAENLAAAATTMAQSPGALQLRTLQTLDSLGSSASNTVVLALPIEVTQALHAVPQLADAVVRARSGGQKEEQKLDRKALERSPVSSESTEEPAQVEQKA